MQVTADSVAVEANSIDEGDNEAPTSAASPLRDVSAESGPAARVRVVCGVAEWRVVTAAPTDGFDDSLLLGVMLFE